MSDRNMNTPSDMQLSLWDSAQAKSSIEPQSPSEERRRYLTMTLTFVLTVTIIVAGFLAPGVVYSALDSDYDRIMVLSSSEESESLLHVFDEPFPLYPWNLYEVENTSALSYTERNTLGEHNVFSFLLTTMAVDGMDVEQLAQGSDLSPTEYVTNLMADAFVYLVTDTENNQGCYVIYSLDANRDGEADLRCAVDKNGTIISLLFLSAPWVVETDPALESEATADVSGTPDPGTGSTTPENVPPEGTTPDDLSQEGTVPEDTAGTTGSELEDPLSTENPYALNLDEYERVPAGEELSIWSYVHLIALCAAENGQTELAAAASLLDTGFSERYSSPDDSKENQSYSPTPTVYATTEYSLNKDYLLYIYDLPTGERFILYFDTAEYRCVGFNLQL